MQFSEQWLRQLVNPAMDSQSLSDCLTMAGLEVEDMQAVAPAFSHVVVAEIIRTEKHPDADRLQVCEVNIGQQTLQIVCGASNARVGLKAPCALVGANLPGIEIKQAKVRGVESFGMMCSAKELGLAAEASGLLELPADAPVGQDIRDYLQLYDQMLTLKLTPNRSDCLSILGIAREVSALTGASLCAPKIESVKASISKQVQVDLHAEQACPRYCARYIDGVNAQAKTPDWMVARLQRSGIRSISAIVDITNYVLLELGQPMHAFDADRVNGAIQVRWAKPQESIKLLNDQTITLTEDILVIADNQSALAFAGVMGGADSAVGDATQRVLLESAFFTPDTIAGKGRRYGISTDSSYRFERGVDFMQTLSAMERATALILEICGGQAGEIVEKSAQLPARKQVSLSLEKLNSILGITLSAELVTEQLNRLGFQFQTSATSFQVMAPSYRFDIEREEDLIEEIARLYGYQHIPALTPTGQLAMLPDSETFKAQSSLQDILVANGYQEVVTYSFVDEHWEATLMGNATPVRLHNPIASNMSVMRSGLWGGLIDALQYNLNRQQDRVRIFEIGAIYQRTDHGFAEHKRISGLVYGAVSPEQWGATSQAADFFDVKADVDALCHYQASYSPAQHPALHPGQSAQIHLDGKAIGWIGKVHPQWQQQFDLPNGVFVFELDFVALQQRQVASYQTVAKFPPVRRDIALLVDQNIHADALLSAMRQAQVSYVQAINLFDLYQGQGIPAGKKSLAFKLILQDTQKSLTDEEIEASVQHLLQQMQQQFGAELRT
jgi:phenylalanyl-tRNA synthetase beta chain